MQKGFSFIVLIIILAIVATAGAGGYVAYKHFFPSNFKTQTQQQEAAQTANWKTYTNSQYGFEFQYPANYTVAAPEKGLYAANNANIIAEMYGEPDSIFITYVKSSILDESSAKYGPEHIWFDQNTNTWTSDIVSQADGHNMISDITFHTGSGDTYFKDHHGVYSNDIFPLSHNSFIILSVADSGPGVDAMDQILSTFKFTK